MQKHDKVKAQLDKTQSSLSKYKSQGNNYEHLTAKLQELQAIHEESKAKRLADVQALEKQLRQVEGDKLTSDKVVARLKEQLRGKEEEIRRSNIEADQQIEELTQKFRREEEKARKTIEALKSGSSQEVETLRTRVSDLQDALADVEDQHEETESQVAGLQRTGLQLARHMNSAIDANEVRRLASHLVRIETRRWKSVAEQSQAEGRAQMKELDELEAEREAWRNQEVQLLQDVESLRRALYQDNSEEERFDTAAVDSEEDEMALLRVRSVQADIDSQIDRMQLDDERQRAESFKEELAVAHEHLLASMVDAHASKTSYEQSRKTLEEVQARNEHLGSDLKRLTEEEDAKTKEVKELRRIDEARQSEIEVLRKENRRLEEVQKSHTTRLSHLAMREEAWLTERAELLESLSEAAAVRVAFDKLQHQMSILAGRSELFEEEAAQLAALNAELASHTNPNQKIVYLDRIRRELDEKRGEVVELRVERDELREKADRLEEEVRVFRSVEVGLDERPRAKFTRVGRVPSASLRASESVKETSKAASLAKSSRVMKESTSSAINTIEGQGREKKEDTLLLKHPHLRRGAGAPRKHVAQASTLNGDDDEEANGEEEGELTLQDLQGRHW